MKPTSDFRPQTLDCPADPEAQLQEHHSLTATLVMIVFLAGFWLLDRWAQAGCWMLDHWNSLTTKHTQSKVGTRCCASLINQNNGAAQQHGPTQERINP